MAILTPTALPSAVTDAADAYMVKYVAGEVPAADVLTKDLKWLCAPFMDGYKLVHSLGFRKWFLLTDSEFKTLVESFDQDNLA